MKLLFASQNQNKVEEIRSLLPQFIDLVGLNDLGFNDDIPETADTLEGNALQKAHYLAKTIDFPIFSDDTGLEIESLNGEPGVYSARYADAEKKDAEANMDLVLKKLEGKSNRNAQFRTAIAFVDKEQEFVFEGIVKGRILETRSGEKGFGYDPIFCPEESQKSFAEMSLEDKNKCSHRARAIKKFVDFLNKTYA
ncbi:MAG: RdgB/HAM1 family non-canonical purine NTP pyrophosphatase [Flavobacteriales bacterium]